MNIFIGVSEKCFISILNYSCQIYESEQLFDKKCFRIVDGHNSFLVLEVLKFLLVDFVSTILAICSHVCDIYDLFVAALVHQGKNTGWFGSHL